MKSWSIVAVGVGVLSGVATATYARTDYGRKLQLPTIERRSAANLLRHSDDRSSSRAASPHSFAHGGEAQPAKRSAVTDLPPDVRGDEERQLDETFEVRDRWLQNVERARQEPRDEAWADATEREIADELERLSVSIHLSSARVDCRTEHCVVDAEWPSREDAAAAEDQLMNVYGEHCERQLLMLDDEQAGEGFAATLLFSCAAPD